MRHPVTIFLILAYAISWTIAELGFRFLPATPMYFTGIAMAFMFGPALAALIVQRFVLKQPLRALGPFFAWNRFIALSIGIALAFAVLHVLVSLLVPGLSVKADTASLVANILSQVPEAQRPAVGSQLYAIGEWLPLVMIGQTLIIGVIAGVSINALFAFGEELGWRGFLHHRLGHWNLWKRAGFIGVFWGLWHLPLLLRGHNFPQNPEWGVLLMVLFCMSVSPLYEFVRERSNALLAPVFLHGVMNATGNTLLFVHGSDLLRGPAGAAGILALLLMNLALFLHLRRERPLVATSA